MKKIRIIQILVVSLTISMLVAPSFADKVTEINNPPTIRSHGSNAKWTVMMYLACDTSLRTKLIPYYIKILTGIGSDNDLNIIALIDGKEKDDTSYYYVAEDLLVPLPWYESESNMADPETFERFLSLTMYNYPADHYALFTLSDFGSGWQGIFCDTNGGGGMKTLSLITIPEVSMVLKNITDDGANKIDVYGIDVCIPGTVEVAYQIAPYVDYMVANQEHGYEGQISDEGFLIGWNYSYYLQELKENPEMTPEQVAMLITDSYRPGTHTNKIMMIIPAPPWYPIVVFYTTLSTINLSKISLLKQSINKLASTFIDNLNNIKNDIKTARSQTREYGKLYRKFWWLPPKIYYGLMLESLGYDCFIDLYDFVEKLKNETVNQEIKNSCIQVMDALNITIIANKALPTDPSHGLSIYFPELKCQYDQSIWRYPLNKNFRKIPSPYEDLQFSQDTSWDEFIKIYLNI